MRSRDMAEMEPVTVQIPQPAQTREDGDRDAKRQHKRKDPTRARVFTDTIVVAAKARSSRRDEAGPRYRRIQRGLSTS
jgi:hypothetical protein